jgi:N-formylglutamate deformylase
VTPIPVVIDCPHSGTKYPVDFSFAVEMEALRGLEDAHIDSIFLETANLGASVLVANVARSYVDCNQDASQINPRMFSLPRGVVISDIANRLCQGVFLQSLPDGRSIYNRRLSLTEAQVRLQNVYFPYRLELERLVVSLRQRFPVIVHLSCHANHEQRDADVCFSSNASDGASEELVAVLKQAVRALGLSVGMIEKQRSGAIVRDTGDPLLGIHSVEVYLRTSLYSSSDYRKLADALVLAGAEFARSCHLSEVAF